MQRTVTVTLTLSTNVDLDHMRRTSFWHHMIEAARHDSTVDPRDVYRVDQVKVEEQYAKPEDVFRDLAPDEHQGHQGADEDNLDRSDVQTGGGSTGAHRSPHAAAHEGGAGKGGG